MNSVVRSLLVAALIGITQITKAAACACCSDPGDRFEGREDLSDYTRGELRMIRLAPNAKLYANAGFPGSVKGLQKPQDGAYRVTWPRAPERHR